MRAIKFRAWTGKKMFYQENQYLGSFIRRAVAEINLDHDREPREHESYLPNGGDIEEYLTQFTGLLDRNGVEVYEGDIIRNPWDETEIGLVSYVDNAFMPSFAYSETASMQMEDGEVVGNVYQNPELLDKGEEK